MLKRIGTSKIIEEGVIVLSVIPFLFKLELNHMDCSMEGNVGCWQEVQGRWGCGFLWTQEIEILCCYLL